MKIKKVFKNILVSLGYYSGIFEILRFFISKKYTPVLLYHCILDSIETKGGVSSFYLTAVGISKSQFESQMKYLGRKYKVLGLKEYIYKIKNCQDVRDTALITFDDGFRDLGLDVLKKYKLPATVFIIGNMFSKIDWRHLLYLILDESSKKEFSLQLTQGCEYKFCLNTPEEKHNAICKIKEGLNYKSKGERIKIINALKEALEVKTEFNVNSVYLAKEEIRNMHKEGLCFGAHSISHENLIDLEKDYLINEIEDSVDLVSALTGEKEIAFSLPFGIYNEKVMEILKRRDVMCNFIGEEGLNNIDQNVYELKRIFVNAHTLPEFVYKISGVESLIYEGRYNLRKILVFLMKKADQFLFFKVGNTIRKITNVNTSEYWDKYFSCLGLFWRDYPYRYLIDYLKNIKASSFSLLDIGCALGDGCELLKKEYPNACIEGADFSKLAVEKAKRKGIDVNFFVLDITKNDPPKKYDFITLVHILEHFNDPFIIIDKCLRYVNKAIFVNTPYTEKYDSPRLYSKGEHRYLFNEHTFSQYKCSIAKITEYIPSKGYRFIIYKLEP